MDPAKSAALAAAQRRVRSGTNKRRGNMAEQLVALQLRARGFLCVEQVHTGYRRVGMRWVPFAKVSGDFRAVERGGTSCLFEVKARRDVLHWSELEPHQHRSLQAHADAGGKSFIVWVHHKGIELLPYPCVGFGPGMSIDATRIPGKAP